MEEFGSLLNPEEETPEEQKAEVKHTEQHEDAEAQHEAQHEQALDDLEGAFEPETFKGDADGGNE